MPGGALTGPASASLVGKLPAHGDFVRAGQDHALVARLDRWLEAMLAGAEPEGLAERLDEMPAWRFALADGDALLAGAVIASRDAVGRSFPLLGAARLEGEAGARAVEGWCADVEHRLLRARDGGASAAAVLAELQDVKADAQGDDLPTEPGWWRDGERIAADALTGPDLARRLLGSAPAGDDPR